MHEVAAAADVVLEGLLEGDVRDARVVVATPLAAYVRAGDAVVGLLAPAAVRVPGSLVTRSPVVAALRPGDVVRFGAGAVDLPGARVRVRRWWDSRVPPLPAARSAPHLELPPLPDEVGPAADAFASALAADAVAAADRAEGDGSALRAEVARAVARAVARLVGLGPGLTPVGDDVVAGALVALVAGDAQGRAGAVLDAVRACRQRTSDLSAALLEHAGAGRAVPQLAAHLHSPGDPQRLARLLAVGGTSGRGLAVGARAGLLATTGSATMRSSRAREVA